MLVGTTFPMHASNTMHRVLGKGSVLVGTSFPMHASNTIHSGVVGKGSVIVGTSTIHVLLNKQ